MSIGFADTLDLRRPSSLDFYRPQALVDPNDPGQRTIRSAPDSVEEWVTWHREHPYLEVSEPKPVTVGGVSGVQIDSATSSVPEGASSLAMWIYDSGSQIRNVKEARGRTIILEVEGDTLLTGVRAGGTNNVEKPFSRAREVLDTAQWSS